MQHPAWCDRAECTASEGTGYHWSRRVALDPELGTDVSATLQICQGARSAAVLVDLTAHLPGLDPADDGEECTLLMGGERAIALGRMLLAVGHAATG